jgi:hypothetical protein
VVRQQAPVYDGAPQASPITTLERTKQVLWEEFLQDRIEPSISRDRVDDGSHALKTRLTGSAAVV